MLRLILLLAGLLLVVRRYRVERAWERDVETDLLGLQGFLMALAPPYPPGLLTFKRRSQAQSKRSSAHGGSLGRALGLLRRFNASQAAILRRLGANGIKESNGTFMESGRSAPDHPIRDY